MGFAAFCYAANFALYFWKHLFLAIGDCSGFFAFRAAAWTFIGVLTPRMWDTVLHANGSAELVRKRIATKIPRLRSGWRYERRDSLTKAQDRVLRRGVTLCGGVKDDEGRPSHACHFERKREIFFVCGHERNGQASENGKHGTPYASGSRCFIWTLKIP